MCTEKLKFHLVHKFVVHKLVYFKNNAYICTQKRARTGGTSAIVASSITFGLHRPCRQKRKITARWKEHLYMECL